LRRAYSIWFVGLIIGAVGLKPVGVSAAGMSFEISRPEIIQGIVYLACLLYSIDAFAGLVVGSPFKSKKFLRRLIYGMSGKRRTLQNISAEQIRTIKRSGKYVFRIVFWAVIAILLIPSIIILLFHRSTVFDALLAVVNKL
jgi:hypothetical protein